MADIFEKATREQLRFATSRGALTTEQMWQLSLNDLNSIGMGIKKELKEAETETLLGHVSKNPKQQLMLDIIVRIIEVKQADADKKKKRAEKAQTLASLKALAAEKTNEEFSKQSLADIRKQIAELEAESED